MTDSIEDLKAQFDEGFIKASKFKVMFMPPSVLATNDKFSSVAAQAIINNGTFAVSLPSSNFASYGWVEKGVPIDLPYQKTFSDFSTSHRVDAEFLSRDYFNAWQSLIMDKSSSHFGYLDDYVGLAQIQQFDDSGKMTAMWMIDRMWPVIVGPIQMSWDSNDTIAIFEVTWKFNILQLIVSQ